MERLNPVYGAMKMKRRKRILSVVLVLMLCLLNLTGCSSGFGSNRYKIVKTVTTDDCYIGFRTDDQIAYYMMGALSQLIADGTVANLSLKWLGKDEVTMKGDENALSEEDDPGSRHVIIGVDESSYPMAYRSNNKYGGFNVDVAAAVCEKLGWTATFLSIDPANAYVELSSGDIDVAWIMPMDHESTDFTSYGPVISESIVIVGLSGAGSSLSGKTLVTDTSESTKTILEEHEKLAKTFGQITRITGGTKECFDALNSGECDYIICTKYAAESYNRSGGNPDYTSTAGEAQYVEPTSVPVYDLTEEEETDSSEEEEESSSEG